MSKTHVKHCILCSAAQLLHICRLTQSCSGSRKEKSNFWFQLRKGDSATQVEP